MYDPHSLSPQSHAVLSWPGSSNRSPCPSKSALGGRITRPARANQPWAIESYALREQVSPATCRMLALRERNDPRCVVAIRRAQRYPRRRLRHTSRAALPQTASSPYVARSATPGVSWRLLAARSPGHPLGIPCFGAAAPPLSSQLQLSMESSRGKVQGPTPGFLKNPKP